MRTPGWTTLAAALSVMSLVACDDAPERLAAPDVGTLAANGADIDTFSTIQFVLIHDAARQLLAAHMPSDICGDGAFNVVRFQRIETPSAIGQILAKQTADQPVSIYHATSLAEAGLASDLSFVGFADLVDIGKFCSFMSGPNRIAEGTVHFLATFSFASFHARWTGTIQGVDGRDYHLTEVYQLNADVHDPNNPDTFTEPVVRIQLHPAP